MYILYVVFGLMATNAYPAPVTMRYSGVYDEQKQRRHLPNCPAMDEVMPRILHAVELWDQRGSALLERIRSVTFTPNFPSEPIVIYAIGCGRGISDPLTVAVFNNGPDGPFIPQTDEEILDDITHELLHHVAMSDEYDWVWKQLKATYGNEIPIVFNHILVLSFEVRLGGCEAVWDRYKQNSDYSRAYILAHEFGILPCKPP